MLNWLLFDAVLGLRSDGVTNSRGITGGAHPPTHPPTNPPTHPPTPTGIGNVTAALKAGGVWGETVMLFAADNGGWVGNFGIV